MESQILTCHLKLHAFYKQIIIYMFGFTQECFPFINIILAVEGKESRCLNLRPQWYNGLKTLSKAYWKWLNVKYWNERKFSKMTICKQLGASSQKSSQLEYNHRNLSRSRFLWLHSSWDDFFSVLVLVRRNYSLS